MRGESVQQIWQASEVVVTKLTANSYARAAAATVYKNFMNRNFRAGSQQNLVAVLKGPWRIEMEATAHVHRQIGTFHQNLRKQDTKGRLRKFKVLLFHNSTRNQACLSEGLGWGFAAQSSSLPPSFLFTNLCYDQHL